ncbi:uncharacterized protein LTR77_007822 [Saxophila tyrrhenica]|uniref:Uncharacterized protein n=1 Tax=Saxophila tyrrhenica TaxID=1690608 RepID=A0AAV9P650_9PEZI|nr:hypothetical protein LTR77_007822 [Saxophila tyrrhenica]
MSERDLVFESYDRGYNEARARFDADDLDSAVALAQNMLDDSSLPRYHRIKLLLLMSAAVDDWEEVASMLDDAHRLWTMTRMFHREGENEEADTLLTDLRQSLDSLIAQHAADRPKEDEEEGEYGEEQEIEEPMEEDVEETITQGRSDEGGDVDMNEVKKEEKLSGAGAEGISMLEETSNEGGDVKSSEVKQETSVSSAQTPSLGTITDRTKLPFQSPVIPTKYVIPQMRDDTSKGR